MSLSVESHKIEVPKSSELPSLSKSDTHALTAEAVGALDRFLNTTILCLPYVGFVFMVYSAGNAIYETKGEPGTVFFVVSSFSLLGLLHLCMREFEKTRDTASKKKKELLKLAVWLLSVALTVLFSYRVTTILDSAALSVFVWSVAFLTSLSGREPLDKDRLGPNTHPILVERLHQMCLSTVNVPVFDILKKLARLAEEAIEEAIATDKAEVAVAEGKIAVVPLGFWLW